MRQLTQEENQVLQQMVKIEPKIVELRNKATRILRDSDAPDFWHRYEQIKGELKKYVGWHADKCYPEFMKTTEAFDATFKYIFNGLAF